MTTDQELLQELRAIKTILMDLHDHLADLFIADDDDWEEIFKDHRNL
ncbi:MAG: hypothetical protein AABX72_03280 [Nanoarchaeota archaeon]